VAEDRVLAGLVPSEPEELLIRGALGTPGRLRIEVGLSEPRFAPRAGRRTPKAELALRRALGGVSYPADRDRVIAEAGRWLSQDQQARDRLAGLPELVYGGELEVLRRLDELSQLPVEPGSEPTPGQAEGSGPDSANPGNQDGSLASR